MSDVNRDELYVVLRGWAVAKPGKVRTYTQLSQDYQALTNEWHEPHGSWDVPLGDINRRVWDELEAPALSALVVLKESGLPGGDFWGCAPNAPPRPKKADDVLIAWAAIVKEVHAYAWPKTYP